MTDFSGAFRRRYGPLQGYDWIRKLDAEARRIFVEMGNQFNEHGHCGGVARARTAQRDERGRFMPDDPLRWIQYG